MKLSGYLSQVLAGSLGQKWGAWQTRFWKTLLSGVLAGQLLAATTHAQDASPDANPDEKQSTFRLGPAKIDVKASFEMEFNDNINYSNSDKESDLILRPGITVAVDCPLTPMNNLSLQLGVAYEQYVVHRDLSSYTNFAAVSPDSKLAFSIRFATFTLTVYDSFNYSVQPSDAFAIDPNTNKIITNVRAFGRFMNQLGVNGDWDLGKVTLYGGAYRYDVFPQQAEFSFLRRWQYTGSAGVRYAFDNGTTLRLDGAYTLNYYQQKLENDSRSAYVGATLAGQIVKNWVYTATLGYTQYSFQQTGTNGDHSQPSTWSGELSITNKLSASVSHTLTLSRTSSFGYVSNTIDLDRIDYKITTKPMAKLDATLDVYVERGNDSGGLAPETDTRYVISPELDYKYSKQTNLYALYEFTDKISNFSIRNYTRNRFVIGLRYEF